jgi:hypothetical protein
MKYYLELLYTQKLSFKHLTYPKVSQLSAAFVRNQITDSGLKVRLVFAVTYIIAVLEAPFDMMLKSILEQQKTEDFLPNFVHGFTQPEIARKVSEFSGCYTYSFDAKGFDHTIPVEVMILSYSYLNFFLLLNDYLTSILKILRNYHCTLPLFHPDISFKPRLRGLSSGSGLTSTLGSFSMYAVHICVLRRYCSERRLDFESVLQQVTVSSDDSIVGTKLPLKVNHYKRIMLDHFGIELELEHMSKPGVNEAFFLGSKWKNNRPYRNYRRLFARIAFGSGNFPRDLTEDLLFASRCYDILGNVADFESIWKSFGYRKFPKRVFRFLELGDFNTQVAIKRQLKGHEHRGIWEDIGYDTTKLNDVWLSR